MHTGPDVHGLPEALRRLQPPLRFLHHPETPRKRPLAHRRFARRRSAGHGRARSARAEPRRAGPDRIRNGVEVQRAPRNALLPRLAARSTASTGSACTTFIRISSPTSSSTIVAQRAEDREIPRHADPAHERSRAEVDESPPHQGQALRPDRKAPREEFRASSSAPRSSSASPARPKRSSRSFARISRSSTLDHVGVFRYSKEEGTKAAEMEDQIHPRPSAAAPRSSSRFLQKQRLRAQREVRRPQRSRS